MTTTTPTEQRSTRTILGRAVSLGYGIGSYLGFLLVLSCSVAFLADIAVPRTVDVALLAVFTT